MFARWGRGGGRRAHEFKAGGRLKQVEGKGGGIRVTRIVDNFGKAGRVGEQLEGDGVDRLKGAGNNQGVIGGYFRMECLEFLEEDETTGLVDYPDGVDYKGRCRR